MSQYLDQNLEHNGSLVRTGTEALVDVLDLLGDKVVVGSTHALSC